MGEKSRTLARLDEDGARIDGHDRLFAKLMRCPTIRRELQHFETIEQAGAQAKVRETALAAEQREDCAMYVADPLLHITVAPTCKFVSVGLGSGKNAIALAKTPGCKWQPPGQTRWIEMPTALWQRASVWRAREDVPLKSDADLNITEITVEQYLSSSALQRRYADSFEQFVDTDD